MAAASCCGLRGALPAPRRALDSRSLPADRGPNVPQSRWPLSLAWPTSDQLVLMSNPPCAAVKVATFLTMPSSEPLVTTNRSAQEEHMQVGRGGRVGFHCETGWVASKPSAVGHGRRGWVGGNQCGMPFQAARHMHACALQPLKTPCLAFSIVCHFRSLCAVGAGGFPGTGCTCGGGGHASRAAGPPPAHG